MALTGGPLRLSCPTGFSSPSSRDRLEAVHQWVTAGAHRNQAARASNAAKRHGWSIKVGDPPPERDSHTYIPGEVSMVQLVQRPRGPEGHFARYARLPWPSDVTQQQIDDWLREFKSGACSGPAKVGPPIETRFWVVAPDRLEPLSIDADSMKVSADRQTITLWRQGELVASMPATYFCVKDKTLTVHK